MFKNRSLAAKILFLSLVMVAVMVVIVATSVWRVKSAQEVTDRVINLRAPTARNSILLLNGVNQTLAALRGWIILGNPAFKNERAEGWSEIDGVLADMESMSREWTNKDNVRRLQEIKSLFGEFRTYQGEIEGIANTADNLPANKMLITQAAPLASVMAEEITRMIDAEAGEAATPERKSLLGMMADVRGTLGLSLGAIRAYLLSGDEKFRKDFDALWEKNEKRFGDLSASQHMLTREQKKSFDAFASARGEFRQLPAKMFEIRGGDQWNMANHWLGTKAAPTAARIKGLLEDMAKDQAALMQKDVDLAHETNSALIWSLYFLLVLGAAISMALGALVTRSITGPLNRIITVLEENSSQVASASGQISASSQSLAEGATEQAASLEETSSSLEEIASMTRQNADNARAANAFMEDSKKMVDNGVSAMGDMVKAMDSIKDSSREISKIISVIEEIAFQTNLLALNAAVEAARAGEHGKGFAVVAEEVRNLAQRSAAASKDTASLIENAVKKADEGGEIVRLSAKALDAIAESTKKSGDLVSEIAAASNEQAQGVEQVSRAVTQMDQVTQQNAATAEESASASEELNAQAESMGSVVKDMVVLVKGAKGTTSDALFTKQTKRPPAQKPKLKPLHVPAPGLPKPKKEPEVKKAEESMPEPQRPAPRKKTPKPIRSEEVIPFDDDDFKDF